jgi:hypothetical protein
MSLQGRQRAPDRVVDPVLVSVIFRAIFRGGEQVPMIRNLIAQEVIINELEESSLFSAPNNPQQAPRMTPSKREGENLSFPFTSALYETAWSLWRVV